MTVTMYARRKRWPLESITVRRWHSKLHVADCESCETRDSLLDHIDRDVELCAALSETQRARLLEIANKCPQETWLPHRSGYVSVRASDRRRNRSSKLCQNCVTCPLKPRSNTVVYGDTSMHITVAGSR
jgi:hypothetical protein